MVVFRLHSEDSDMVEMVLLGKSDSVEFVWTSNISVWGHE